MLRLRDFLFNVKEMYTNVFLTYLYARLSILLLYYLFVDFNFKTRLIWVWADYFELRTNLYLIALNE